MRFCSHQRGKAVEGHGLGHSSSSSPKMDGCVSGTLINSSIRTLAGGSPVWSCSKETPLAQLCWSRQGLGWWLQWQENPSSCIEPQMYFPFLHTLCDWGFSACSDEYKHKHTHHFLFHLNGTSSQCSVDGISAADVHCRTLLMILLCTAINTSFSAPFDDFTIMRVIKEPWWISKQHILKGNSTDRALQEALC